MKSRKKTVKMLHNKNITILDCCLCLAVRAANRQFYLDFEPIDSFNYETRQVAEMSAIRVFCGILRLNILLVNEMCLSSVGSPFVFFAISTRYYFNRGFEICFLKLNHILECFFFYIFVC